MVYWIGISVISNSPGLLTAVENAIPVKIDNKLWQSDEYQSFRGVDDGNDFFYASLFFNDLTDRENFNVVLRGINGMLNSALPGSYIKMTKCYHDEKVNNLCPKLDEITFEEII